MEALSIILGTIAATTSMTAFSYIASVYTGNQFREPELLNILLSRAKILKLKISKKNVAGWLIHYSVGTLFIVIFYLIWNNSKLEVSLVSGAYLGYLAGIVGISGWKIFFLLSPDPPKIKLSEFYFQLLVAHIVFGLGAVLVKYLFD